MENKLSYPRKFAVRFIRERMKWKNQLNSVNKADNEDLYNFIYECMLTAEHRANLWCKKSNTLRLRIILKSKKR